MKMIFVWIAYATLRQHHIIEREYS